MRIQDLAVGSLRLPWVQFQLAPTLERFKGLVGLVGDSVY